MTASDKERSASTAERKRAAGLVKVSVSPWVKKEDADKARKALKREAAKHAAPWPVENGE